MEGVKAVEGERGLRPVISCGEPSGAQELSTIVNNTVRLTVTVVNRNIMNSSRVENAEICRPTGRVSTRETAMTELYTKPKAFKSHVLEIFAIPLLRRMHEQSR